MSKNSSMRVRFGHLPNTDGSASSLEEQLTQRQLLILAQIANDSQSGSVKAGGNYSLPTGRIGLVTAYPAPCDNAGLNSTADYGNGYKLASSHAVATGSTLQQQQTSYGAQVWHGQEPLLSTSHATDTAEGENAAQTHGTLDLLQTDPTRPQPDAGLGSGQDPERSSGHMLIAQHSDGLSLQPPPGDHVVLRSPSECCTPQLLPASSLGQSSGGLTPTSLSIGGGRTHHTVPGATIGTVAARRGVPQPPSLSSPACPSQLHRHMPSPNTHSPSSPSPKTRPQDSTRDGARPASPSFTAPSSPFAMPTAQSFGGPRVAAARTMRMSALHAGRSSTPPPPPQQQQQQPVNAGGRAPAPGGTPGRWLADVESASRPMECAPIQAYDVGAQLCWPSPEPPNSAGTTSPDSSSSPRPRAPPHGLQAAGSGRLRSGQLAAASCSDRPWSVQGPDGADDEGSCSLHDLLMEGLMWPDAPSPGGSVTSPGGGRHGTALAASAVAAFRSALSGPPCTLQQLHLQRAGGRAPGAPQAARCASPNLDGSAASSPPPPLAHAVAGQGHHPGGAGRAHGSAELGPCSSGGSFSRPASSPIPQLHLRQDPAQRQQRSGSPGPAPPSPQASAASCRWAMLRAATSTLPQPHNPGAAARPGAGRGPLMVVGPASSGVKAPPARLSEVAWWQDPDAPCRRAASVTASAYSCVASPGPSGHCAADAGMARAGSVTAAPPPAAPAAARHSQTVRDAMAAVASAFRAGPPVPERVLEPTRSLRFVRAQMKTIDAAHA